jgi:hypothetical protein
MVPISPAAGTDAVAKAFWTPPIMKLMRKAAPADGTAVKMADHDEVTLWSPVSRTVMLGRVESGDTIVE